jgi:hypothetical protein
MTPNQFQKMVAEQMTYLNKYRGTLNSDIDFSKTQDHTFTEHLYISYMEPSLLRLSQEWNMPVENLRKIVAMNSTHVHEEFKNFGELYSRKDLRELGPFKGAALPESIREENETEPDFFKTKP